MSSARGRSAGMIAWGTAVRFGTRVAGFSARSPGKLSAQGISRSVPASSDGPKGRALDDRPEA